MAVSRPCGTGACVRIAFPTLKRRAILAGPFGTIGLSHAGPLSPAPVGRPLSQALHRMQGGCRRPGEECLPIFTTSLEWRGRRSCANNP